MTTMWMYPAGAIINGVLTTEPTVRCALPFELNGVQYSEEVFVKWPLSELNSLGIKSFIEDAVASDYDGGVPVDVVTDSSIHRTYPNATLNEDRVKAKQKAVILQQLADLDSFIPRGLEDLCLANEALLLSLPVINQDRIAAKVALRAELKELTDGPSNA